VKAFSGVTVLENISVTFDKGKTNLIIGRSGSGKTVLMKCLVGLHEVDQGAVYYDDRNFVNMDFRERKKIRREIGMLFQGSALFDSLTVEENVMFPLNMFTSMSLKEKLERTNTCLRRVNLTDVNKLYPGELSGGMKKRVAIARAIVENPVTCSAMNQTPGLTPKQHWLLTTSSVKSPMNMILPRSLTPTI